MKYPTIYTNVEVESNYSRKKCFLRRQIVSSNIKDKSPNITTFVIKTDLVELIENQIPILDKDAKDTNQIEITKSFNYVSDKETYAKSVTDKERDLFWSQLKDFIKLGDSLSEFDFKVKEIMLLNVTQQDKAWGLEPKIWISEDEALATLLKSEIIDKPIEEVSNEQTE